VLPPCDKLDLQKRREYDFCTRPDVSPNSIGALSRPDCADSCALRIIARALRPAQETPPECDGLVQGRAGLGRTPGGLSPRVWLSSAELSLEREADCLTAYRIAKACSAQQGTPVTNAGPTCLAAARPPAAARRRLGHLHRVIVGRAPGRVEAFFTDWLRKSDRPAMP
jgi:hypothetical protein